MKIETIGDQVIITVTCPKCKNDITIMVKLGDWLDFLNRKKLIQHCFPYLTTDQRELLMSGICGECWNKVFKDED